MKKNVSNKIMLITYPDSLGKNLKDLDFTLSQYLDKAVGGVHILPFFPSSGDRGLPTSRWNPLSGIGAISKRYRKNIILCATI